MSNHALSWAWKQDAGDPTAKLLLIKLADQANDDGVSWPSRATLAGECGISVATVKRRLGMLAERGLLVIEQRRGNGGLHSSNLYRLSMDGGSTVTHGANGGSAATAGQQVSRHGGSTVTHEPSVEPSVEDVSARELRSPSESLPSPTEPKAPPLSNVGGRNLGYDALADVCQIDPGSPRTGEIVAALNGRRGSPGIRQLFWLELRRWRGPGDGDYERTFDEIVKKEPERFEKALALGIRAKAAKYRDRMDGALLTPTALAKWWLDLERMTPTDGRLTGADVRDLGV